MTVAFVISPPSWKPPGVCCLRLLSGRTPFPPPIQPSVPGGSVSWTAPGSTSWRALAVHRDASCASETYPRCAPPICRQYAVCTLPIPRDGCPSTPLNTAHSPTYELHNAARVAAALTYDGLRSTANTISVPRRHVHSVGHQCVTTIHPLTPTPNA